MFQARSGPKYTSFFVVMGARLPWSSAPWVPPTVQPGVALASWPELTLQSTVPVVMAGLIAIYRLVVAVLIVNSLNDGISFLQLGAVLCRLAAGSAFGIVGGAGRRGCSGAWS